jgi:hypothetical protein
MCFTPKGLMMIFLTHAIEFLVVGGLATAGALVVNNINKNDAS